MIPHRVRLSGFLSYKEEQDVYFENAPLWMLTGSNGSGKSTVFDALTFALFGHHRGGSQQNQELINKESNQLLVEFEFRIDQQLYQIRRTLKRNPKGGASGTQQIYHQKKDTTSNKPIWEAIPDTNRKVDFDNWIQEKIGLNYETFTSSVLLLQGRAEKLLDSKPSGRADVLAGIVDLERYKNLHEKADNRRRELKVRLEAVQNQLTAIPEISDMELFAAEQQVDEAEEAKQLASQKVDTLHKLEFEAGKWQDIQFRLQNVHKQWSIQAQLFSQAEIIQQSYLRYKELKEVLPFFQSIMKARSDIEQSNLKSTRLEKDLTTLQEKLKQTEHNLETSRKKRVNLQKIIHQDENRQQQVISLIRDISSRLSQLKMLEELQSKQQQLEKELKRFPNNLSQQMHEVETNLERALEIQGILPNLERFARERELVSQSKQRIEHARLQESQILKEGEKLKKEYGELKKELEIATNNRQRADEAVTESRTLFQQAKLGLADFQQLEGKKICRHCGQNLTPGHFLEEKKKREMEYQQAEQQFSIATNQQEKAIQKHKELLDRCSQLEPLLEKRREDYRDTRKEVEQATKDLAKQEQECRTIYLALPESERQLIAKQIPDDWTKTKYPAIDNLNHYQQTRFQCDLWKRRIKELQIELDQSRKIEMELQVTIQQVNHILEQMSGVDISNVRKQHLELHTEEDALKKNLQVTKKSLDENEKESDRLNRELNTLIQQRSEYQSNLNTEEVSRKHHQESIERSRKQLPETWRTQVDEVGLSDQLRWKVELDDLINNNIEQKYEQLSQARSNLERLKQEKSELDDQLKTIPQDAHCDPSVIRTKLDLAKTEVKNREYNLQQARQHKALLDRYRQQRLDLNQQVLDVERQHNHFVLLSQLLGRERLQRHLVRQAERQIVDYANGVLDRLSGGELCLRLCGEEGGTDRALELEAYNRATGGDAINVAFLSGSQRFRVAVSLALGIGQYASRQHRPIESVIIDEGFGCLDRQGRQVMIQELQNLRGHLQCILLVSHQEEFADAFPDGYRFELQNGATRVTRLQR